MKKIRNFSIIAHIDHGKSTLADRLMEYTGLLERVRVQHSEQILDDMELERERGITIKANTVRLEYMGYVLNLVDTPGHVDFSYEVSRSLASCEGAILLVDASQGVEAQTIANFYIALDNDLTIIPVINKIDLPNANIEKVEEELYNLFGFTSDEIVKVSAKNAINIDILLNRIISDIPSPRGEDFSPLRALIFDSFYDPYVGVVAKIRVFDGRIRVGDRIKLFSSGKDFEVMELGVFEIVRRKVDELRAGEIGYVIAGIKDIRDMKVGDTITSLQNPAKEPLKGYKEPKPMVFSGLYPINTEDYEDLKKALMKLRLNDSAFHFEMENSKALGFGFRCGYLGLLHMEIVKERIEREFQIPIITTAPNVIYRVYLQNGEVMEIDNPALFPDGKVEKIEEPYIKAYIFVPSEYVGNIMKLMTERRGKNIGMSYISSDRVELIYEIPFAEVMYDFYDKLKSVSRGYASFDYEHIGYREGDLVKLTIYVHKVPEDALSVIVHKDKAYYYGRKILEKLKKVIPRQLFEVVLQAGIGSKIIARESIPALRKNVTAKCYGGDITRKRKLLEKQKEGKKRLKRIGRVDIPQEAFLSVIAE